MTNISDRRIAPTGTIDEIMVPLQDEDVHPTRVKQHIGHLEDQSSPICTRCQRTDCPSLRGSICPLPDMSVVNKLLGQLQSSNRR